MADSFLLGVLLLFAAYPIYICIYNIYFHPLAKFPGPKAWAATRQTFVVSLWKGNLVRDVRRIHNQYGDIVRIAPNELSFANGAAWKDIHTQQPGSPPFPKNPVWWAPGPGQPDSIITVKNEDHTRMRRLLNHSFSEKALKAQEHIVQSYVELLITRLRGKTTAQGAEKRKEATLDIVQWLNYTTFDIVGDLGFGESFNCLQDSSYHPWVELIFNPFKASVLLASIRFYPLLNSLLMSCLPKSMMKIQRDHFQLAVDKVHRRLNLEMPRDDFLSHILKHNDEKGMTVPEIEATFNIVIVAGSETTATVLSGIINYLLRNPHVLQLLVKEVRSTFIEEKEITFAAVKEDLPFLNAVIEEGLRLCPPIPAGLPRMVPKGGATVCGHFLPEDTNVSVHQSTLFRSPSCFFQPYAFLPERWLPSALDPSSPFAFDKRSVVQPFSVGPQHCIGKMLAYAEMRLILARLVWAFDLGVAAPRGEGMVKWDEQKTYMLIEKMPLEIRITQRHD